MNGFSENFLSLHPLFQKKKNLPASHNFEWFIFWLTFLKIFKLKIMKMLLKNSIEIRIYQLKFEMVNINIY